MTATGPDVRATAARVVALARSRQPTLGTGRLVCVDGPAGSGKTTLAAAVGATTGAPVLHCDDLLEGWRGLPGLQAQVRALLGALAEDRPGWWRRWDWASGRWAEEHRVDPVPLLLVEGVGAGQRAWAALTTVLVWVEAPDAVRLARGLARDGEAMREHWLRWMRDEAAHFAADRPAERADLVVPS